MLVLAGEVELAAHLPGDRVVVDLERVTQAVELAPDDAEPRVDLVAAVIAWIAEREGSVGVNLRVAEADETVRDRHVVVLDDDAARGRAPLRIPGTNVGAGEITFDTR